MSIDSIHQLFPFVTFPTNCILAIDEQNGIATNNKIPWSIHKDRQFFHTVTTSSPKGKKNVVIMGRKTWEQLPLKILNDRINIVLTKTVNKKYKEGLYFCENVVDALKLILLLSNTISINEIFICGGKELYELFINYPCPIIKKLYVTKIKKNYNTNTIVNMNLELYKEIKLTSVNTFDNNSVSTIDMDFYEYERIQNTDELGYLNLLKRVITNGHYRQTRNSKTYSCFSDHIEFNLENYIFPLLTTKKMFLRGIFEELKFFLTGKTDTKLLEQKGVNIWKLNTSRDFLDSVGLDHLEEGDMGPLYSFQLRHFNAKYNGCHENYDNQGIDQFANVLHLLKTDKYSRRILMTTYNPSQINQAPLPPCHGIAIQFGVENDNKLCCHMYQRSMDLFLGSPFNIASYSLLIFIICELINNDKYYYGEKFIPGKLSISIGDLHIYEEHVNVVEEQIKRIPFHFPTLNFNKKISSIDELEFEHLNLINYNYYPTLKGKMIA